MTQMRAKPTACAPLRTIIDTGRSRVAGGGDPLFVYIRALFFVIRYKKIYRKWGPRLSP